jgi:DNA polymerase III subunit alpha
MDGFVHLHVHSHYSLLDGCARIEDLVETAHAAGMPALALTDHGNLFGAMEFYQAASAGGVKPILGMEAYISPTTRQDRSMGRIETAGYHLILLAMNETGWRNLMCLSSRAYLEGFYYRPRVDRQLLSQFNEGIVCQSACLKGEVSAALLAGQTDKARRMAGEYRDIFGKDRFFIEVMNIGVDEQDRVNPQLLRIAEEIGVGVVGTNDVHFLKADDKPAHGVLTCISTGKTLQSDSRMEYSPHLWLKPPAEMRKALAHLPGAADGTLRVAEMCGLKLDLSRQYLPHFPIEGGRTPEAELERLAREGLAGRFHASGAPDHYRQRLESELKVIADKGYSSYFLIVNDFVQYARRSGIPAAPRGSGVGTLLGYALGITNVDPVRYGLLFERFTDPQRSEAPDMDIDLCQIGRDQVIQYVRQKYGHVAQIITFGTLKARAVVRDVGRVMDMPLPEVDAIAKMVPETLGMTLDGALEAEPRLREACQKDARVRQLIDYGKSLEGLARHAGVHAAGVIVAQQPLETIVPLCRQADSDAAITQWDGETCTKAGLMKMDFLGLSTLSILERARLLARHRTGDDVDPETLPLDDPAVYELFRQGHTDGVFQFESGGMKNILVQMKPTRIEDLIAANAMYRPGPMELIPTYCNRKNGLEAVESIHPIVDDILAETYGIMAYQEQVMMVLSRLGKLPLGRAYRLIKAISKKKEKEIAAERSNFLAGARENGLSEQEAENVFELILRFAGYGFNKSHSTRYAIIAYQTAWFKVRYPCEFMAALLTFESGDTDKVLQYRAEAQRMGIDVQRPDINTCGADFTTDGKSVRYGLAAVKGVGVKAVDAVTEARRQVGAFTDLYHFCQHVDLKAVNKATLEAFIKCGAFDALGAHRGAMMAALEEAIELGQSQAAARKSGQMSLLDAIGGGAAAAPKPRFPDVEPWSEATLLAGEKESLGFYVSSHPLVRYGRELAALSWPTGTDLAKLGELASGTPVTVGCLIASIRHMVTKSGRSAGKQMAMLGIEDLTGKSGAVAFAETYEQIGGLLQDQAIVFLCGTVDRSRERPSVIIRDVVPLEASLGKLTGSLLLRVNGAACAAAGGSTDFGEPQGRAASASPPSGPENAPQGTASEPANALSRLAPILARHKGACPVYVQLRPSSRPGVRATIRLDKQWHVAPSRALIDELEAALGGQEYLLLSPRPQAPAGNAGRFNGAGRHASRAEQ